MLILELSNFDVLFLLGMMKIEMGNYFCFVERDVFVS